MQSKQQNHKKKINLTLAGFFVVILVILSILNKFNILTYDNILVELNLKEDKSTESEVSVHFIDVGQGDCILILSGEKSVLIDAGDVDEASKVVAYLKAQNINKIDYIIATHPHSDHIGGLPEVIKAFEVGKIYMAKVPDNITPTTVVYENLLKAIKNKYLKISSPDFGEILDLGDSRLELFPPKTEYDNLNNCSIVSKLTHGKNTYLFTGDAEKEVEQDLIKSKIDLNSKVLKVGHHGSNTSSTKDFLKEVNPQICVICCGVDNSYNHPNAKIVKRLNDYTESIFRTDMLGTIVIESDGENLKYKYENGE